MNQTIQELFNRKSVRMYCEDPITKEEKSLILEAAAQAPTAGNMALYSIIDVQDQSLKEELAVRCDNQPFIAKAWMVLIFLADYQKWFDMFKEYVEGMPKLCEADLFLAIQDCVIAAQNAVVAAESLGIGSCYIGDILENYEDNQKLLHLPKYAVPQVMVVFGKPTPQQKERKKQEHFKVEDLIHVDTYRQRSIEETKQMFQDHFHKDEEQIQKQVEDFASRKFLCAFREEINRSAKAIIDHWNE